MMKMSTGFRMALVALTVFASAVRASAAHADEGFVQLTIYKAGWVIGGSGGSGVLDFRGRRYGLSTGGPGYGFLFRGTKTLARGPGSKKSRPPRGGGGYCAGRGRGWG